MIFTTTFNNNEIMRNMLKGWWYDKENIHASFN